MIDKIPEIVSISIKNDISDVNRISNNTRNVNTIGFKSILKSNIEGNESVSINKLLNLSAGEIKATDRNLDLAINGDGWFVLKNNFNFYLSKDGQFFIGENGKLINKSGYALQGFQGNIYLTNSDVKVNNLGEINHDGKIIDRLMILKPEQIKPEQLHEGFITIKDISQLSVSVNSDIRQGYLEGANVDPSAAVISLMSNKRHIETMQRTLSVYDSIMQKAISDLGK